MPKALFREQGPTCVYIQHYREKARRNNGLSRRKDQFSVAQPAGQARYCCGVQPTGFHVAAGRRRRMDATIEDAEERNAGKGTTHLPTLMDYCYKSYTYRRTGQQLPA